MLLYFLLHVHEVACKQAFGDTEGGHLTHLPQFAHRLVIGIYGHALSISSLCSRRLEVVSTGKNERARGRHVRGEGAPAWKAHKNHLLPQSNYPAAAV